MVRHAVLLILLPATAWADGFDRYTRPVLAAAVEAGKLKEVKALTPELLGEAGRVVPGVDAALVVVATNDGRLAKLLVQPARQKSAGGAVPMLLVERFVTFKDGGEQAVHAKGEALAVYPGFRLSLDLGQLVPERLGGDFQVAESGSSVSVAALGKAKLYLVETPPPAAATAKPVRMEPGAKFEPRYLAGTYHLHDDGRRSGLLTLAVADDGTVTGSYVSDKDKDKYEVTGAVGTPNHAVAFTVRFPRAEVIYEGRVFTGDAAALAGTSKLLGREAGFYAVRVP